MFFTHSALWLWLAPLVALPAFIHLLNRKFPRIFRFSSIEQIKKSIAQRSKLFRWRHLILALLRTAAILLLLLAFLKPVKQMFGSKPDETGPRHVLVMFDHSLSMEHKEGSLTGRKRAALELEKIINTLGTDDLINVRAVGREAPACFPEFSGDHSEALRFVRALERGLGRADFNKANAAIALELKSAHGRQEVYYISDFQRASWADVDLAIVPESARLFFVNVASKERANHAIIGARIDPREAGAVQVHLGNFAPVQWTGEVEVIIDGKRSSKADATLAAWSVGKVSVPIQLGAPGLHTIEARIAEDDLPQDDHYFLSSQSAAKEEVLIVTDEGGGKSQSAGFFLSKALNPFDNLGGSLLPKPTNSASLTASRLATVRKVFLTTLDKLTPETCGALAKFVKDGGSIVYFSDGKFDAENLRLLDKAGGGDFAPLQLTKKQETANLASGAQQIMKGDFRSKYLRIFQGSQRQNLALMEFYEYYHALPASQGSVLLSYADGSPALAASHPALGTFLLCNFSVNELASNMARQRAFPAWIQDLVKALDSEETPDKPLEAGEEIHTDVWQAEMNSASVTAPDGRAVRTSREVDGARYHITFAAEQQGIYRLSEGPSAYAFAINTPPDEADLRSVDLNLLPRRLGANQSGHFVEGLGDFNALNSGRPLFHYFLFGVISLLLLELTFQILFRRLARTT